MSKANHTFFCADLNFGVLNEDESHHASRVMRLNEGDQINLVNGKGRICLAKITSVDKKEVGFEIVHEYEQERHPVNIHVLIAPTKSIDRFTFFLEKATEFGAREITPILTSNSERKILKVEKLQKGMISALKQSGNLYLPKLNELTPFKDVVNNDYSNATKVIAYCDVNTEKKPLHTYAKDSENLVILIGPEGDFTAEEVILAKENGFSGVTLGDARFRTETAGIVACHTAYLYSL